MLSKKKIMELTDICNALLEDFVSIRKLCENMNMSQGRIRVYVSMSIVLKIVSDESAEILMNKLYKNSGRTKDTENYYDYILQLKRLRKKLEEKIQFLQFFLNKRNLKQKQKDELTIRIKELQNELLNFEKTKIYKKVSEDYIKKFITLN